MLVNLLLATKDVKIVVAMAPRNLCVLNLAHNPKVFTNNFECQLATRTAYDNRSFFLNKRR